MARRKAVTFATVLELGRALPDVEAATSWGGPSLKVRGRMFACAATHKSAEPDTLVVRMDIAQRDELIAADPDTYYLKDHYIGYACVLVRLARVHPDALRDLLQTAWRFMSRSDNRVKRRRPGGGRMTRASATRQR
jgi:hypothetical protein